MIETKREVREEALSPDETSPRDLRAFRVSLALRAGLELEAGVGELLLGAAAARGRTLCLLPQVATNHQAPQPS